MSDVENKGGTFVGNSHDDGGIPFVVPETGQHIEVEGKEPLIASEALESDKKIKVEGTNKEILNKINESVGAKSLDEKATKVHAGDFIICKKSAADTKKRVIVGTPKQVVSAVNASCGCKNPYAGAEVKSVFANGGGVSEAEFQKGVKVEKEHRDLYEYFMEDYARMGFKMPLTDTQFFGKIANAHFKENKKYYHILDENNLKKGGRTKQLCPVGTEIQSLIFSKDSFNDKSTAIKWAAKHNFKHNKVDEKTNTFRLRQIEPSKFELNGYATIELREGVQAVIGCPKKYGKGGSAYFKTYDDADLFKEGDVIPKETLNKKLLFTVQLKHLFQTENVNVFSVNANYVRTFYPKNGYKEAVDWNSGGHYRGWGGGMEFVPDGEAWVDDSATPLARNGFIVHELNEYFNMKYYGMDYQTAHGIANKVEQVYLKKHEGSDGKDLPINFLGLTKVETSEKYNVEDEIKSELRKLYKGSDFEKAGLVESRISQLLEIESAWLEKAKKSSVFYSPREIAEILIAYEKDLRGDKFGQGSVVSSAKSRSVTSEDNMDMLIDLCRTLGTPFKEVSVRQKGEYKLVHIPFDKNKISVKDVKLIMEKLPLLEHEWEIVPNNKTLVLEFMGTDHTAVEITFESFGRGGKVKKIFAVLRSSMGVIEDIEVENENKEEAMAKFQAMNIRIPSGTYITFQSQPYYYSKEGGTVELNGWEKQPEWFGNSSLGFDSYRKVFPNPFNNKSVPVYIFGKEGYGKNASPDWSYVVSAGANSDYSYTGGFYPEKPTIKEAMQILDEKFAKGKLIYKEGGIAGDGDGIGKWQIKNKNDKYLSIAIDGKPQWFPSPDFAATYTHEEAEKLKAHLESIGHQDLSVEKYNKDWWKMAQGGVVAEDLVGRNVLINKSDYSQVEGKVIKVSEQKLKLDLTKGIKGIETNLWLTVVDDKGKEHIGSLAELFAKGGSVSEHPFYPFKAMGFAKGGAVENEMELYRDEYGMVFTLKKHGADFYFVLNFNDNGAKEEHYFLSKEDVASIIAYLQQYRESDDVLKIGKTLEFSQSGQLWVDVSYKDSLLGNLSKPIALGFSKEEKKIISFLKNEFAKGGAVPEEHKAILSSIESSSIIDNDVLAKYDIVKETYKDWKIDNAEQVAKTRKNELEQSGYSVKLKKWNFDGDSSYSVTAIKPKEATPEAIPEKQWTVRLQDKREGEIATLTINAKDREEAIKTAFADERFSVGWILFDVTDGTKSIFNQDRDLLGDYKLDEYMTVVVEDNKPRVDDDIVINYADGQKTVNYRGNYSAGVMMVYDKNGSGTQFPVPEDNFVKNLHKPRYSSASTPERIQAAIENSSYQEWISEGRMTANDAKIIIESAGLPVPEDIIQSNGITLDKAREFVRLMAEEPKPKEPTYSLHKRTFEATEYPKDSPERKKLNMDSLTSEYMTSYKYLVKIDYPETETNNAYSDKRNFVTKKEAEDFIEEKGFEVKRKYDDGGKVRYQELSNKISSKETKEFDELNKKLHEEPHFSIKQHERYRELTIKISPYEARMAKFEIEQNADAPNYVEAIKWAKKHGYHLSKDISYNGYLYFEKYICDGDSKIELKVYDDIKKKSQPDLTIYDREAHFGNIMDKTTYSFVRSGSEADLEVKNLGELFALAEKKESQLEKKNSQAHYILYLDKDNRFRETKKEFYGKNSYEEAVKWGKENLPNFNIDMVRFLQISKDKDSEVTEWKQALDSLKELIEIGGSASEIKEWKEAVEALGELLGNPSKEKVGIKTVIVPNKDDAYGKQAQKYILKYLKLHNKTLLNKKAKFIMQNYNLKEFDIFALVKGNVDDIITDIYFYKDVEKLYQGALNMDLEDFHVIRETKTPTELIYDYYLGNLFNFNEDSDLYDEQGKLKESVKQGAINDMKTYFKIEKMASGGGVSEGLDLDSFADFDKLKEIEKRALEIKSSKNFITRKSKLLKLRKQWDEEVKRLDSELFHDDFNKSHSQIQMRNYKNGKYVGVYRFSDLVD